MYINSEINRMNRIFFFFGFLILSLNMAYGQDHQAGNQVLINAGDSHAEIIRKAANVSPSSRQLNWQKLELTAFFHFGINTFTNREWGDGTEDPKIFNPTKLDARQWVKIMKEAVVSMMES